ncbi:uncharacterized protein PHACADRAFT_254136 [Phanerochaete carnosa HHB-10118-sp]|uniref:Uncharacterized protein n=1 Tax=Phanerochaete carnosa (strain HHB-10118-sp) TaxID=650164 RepID=K5V2Q7_PHACS|nr:uncharacterized protein PHACADRAFT_254136 [Phanerochaete carnosa HHB-10118-sp]EKM56811.1 hypothetical protein PHACADRAFT_254136 [Phanerochaete carnosa HHB-10118-sp]
MTFNSFYTILGSTGVDGYANGSPVGFGENILISVTDFVGECILMYRCWGIWGGNLWVIAVPFTASLTALACFCGGIGLILQIAPTSPSPPPAAQPLVFAAYILPLIANFMLTVLIAGRIWWLTGINTYTVTSLTGRKSIAFKTAMIIIESGVLYFVVQLVYLTVFAVGNSSDQLMSLVAVQVYGIAPTLIIIQVGLGFSSEESTRPTMTSTGLSFVHGGLSQGTTRTTTSAPTSDMPSTTRFGNSEPDIMIAGSRSNIEFSENPEKKEAFLVSAV